MLFSIVAAPTYIPNSAEVFPFLHILTSICYLLSFSFFINLFIYLFIFGCIGSSFLCKGFLYSWQAGATLHCSAWASPYRGLSSCGAQAPDAQAQ